jgi:hypothetical protein
MTKGPTDSTGLLMVLRGASRMNIGPFTARVAATCNTFE